MEKDRRRQSKERMPATKLPTTVNDIPNHLLKLIFRLLDSHVSFIRAASVCTRWRHILSSRGLRWRDCNYHDFTSIMGHYHVIDPSFSSEPRSSQPQRRRGRVVFIPALPSINIGHFTLDFLPSGHGSRPWQLVDGHGSLLHLTNQRRRSFFPDIVVCEPISRRYVEIKPIEDMKYCRCLGVFLNHYAVSSMSSFSLTCMVYQSSTGIRDDGVSFVTAYVYTQEAPWCRRWRQGWSTSRHAMSGGIHIRGAESVHYAGRSKGSMFWGIEDDGSVFSRQEGTGGVFSHFHLPVNVRGGSHHRSTFRFVDDGADNLVRVVSLIGKDLRVFLKKEHNNGGSDWVLMRTLHLPEATLGLPGYKEFFFSQTAKIVTAGKGYVVLTPAEETWLFSVELGTMQVERGHIRNKLVGEVYPYELRLRPKVSACLLPCKRGREGRCYDMCKCK